MCISVHVCEILLDKSPNYGCPSMVIWGSPYSSLFLSIYVAYQYCTMLGNKLSCCCRCCKMSEGNGFQAEGMIEVATYSLFVSFKKEWHNAYELELTVA